MRERLAAEIRAAQERAAGAKIEYGRNDCLIWIADIYRNVMGVDPATEYRGRYVTAWGAMRLLGRTGVAGALERASIAMGWPEIAPDDAVSGDLGLMETDTGASGVICARSGLWLGRSPEGFTAVPTVFAGQTLVTRCWSVCR